MDINLPLILFLAVFITGLIWLFDRLVLAKSRAAGLQAVDERFAKLSPQEREKSQAYQEARDSVKKEPLIVEYSKSFFPILAFVFVLRSFLIEPFQIPSESMLPTLEVGDFIAVNKFAYGIRLPVINTKIMEVGQLKHGDVVVFFPPHENRYFIKRVVGLPGDTVRYSNHVLYVNGEQVEQEYARDDDSLYGAMGCPGQYVIMEERVKHRTYETRKCTQPGMYSREGQWHVPEGHYFMMGDNRDNSEDSRGWPDPFVPDENIVGKAFAIWMQWHGGLPSFQRAGRIR